MGIAIYMLTFLLLLIGVYALVAKKNLVRIIMGIAILEYAVNLLLVLVGYRRDGTPPILPRGQTAAELAARAVDPLPQALVLTSIVIGLSVTALAVALAVRLYDKYGTFDMNDIRNLRG
ncbi:MAG: cation:proton antiporter [Phycisphaerae bacterium SM23_33]|jgi:multicomponent Na+:H+ antiporter subunit C|nr:MAG: cation:proton antiporter [Phycisphaerae bacterium SM23_33]